MKKFAFLAGINQYGILPILKFARQDAEAAEELRFAPEPGDVKLPLEIFSNPGIYEKCWKADGISGKLALSPDGKFLAIACGNRIKILEYKTGKVLKTLEGHTWWVSSVNYSPDGQYLASGSGDNTIRIWNVQTGECVKTLEGYMGGVGAVSYTPDGQYLASGSGDKTVRIWKM